MELITYLACDTERLYSFGSRLINRDTAAAHEIVFSSSVEVNGKEIRDFIAVECGIGGEPEILVMV